MEESLLREEEVNRLRESQEIFDKFFKWLFGVIALKNTDMGDALFKRHPNIMMLMVLMIVLYFLVWLLGTMLPCRGIILLMILVFIMLLIAAVSSVLILTIISSRLACLAVTLWVAVLPLIAYHCYKEFHKLVVCAISEIIKLLIESFRVQRTRFPL
ncbi:hypothetical protein RJT34_29120 [Clitoria ternatea]|uniref:Uncharacterized protein n=1 Tax=Clitoria ternatea TaxID=43366 RepID=A0AAN9FBR7_CLITE